MFENATLHEYNADMQASSGWRGWYTDAQGQCIGFLGTDGQQVAWDAATDTVTVL